MLAENQTPDKSAAAQGNPADPSWAWKPYAPDGQRPWNLARAGHLYRRAAFGANWDQLQQALADGPQRTIDRLLKPEGNVAGFLATFDGYEDDGGGSTEGLRAWWLRRMLQTPHPLLEKMTLFWHNHFAVSNAAVKNAEVMQQHIRSLRSQALGRFDVMLAAVAHDPAMLLGLDAAANRKAQPTEHFSRALMSQFCLGTDQFQDSDVHEAARAFSGWFVLMGQMRFIERERDPGLKQILGRQGKFDDADVVRLLLEQPATPRLLVRKLYRWLISETDEPSDALLQPLAESFSRQYDIAGVVATMLRSNLFFSPAAYRTRVKSPVEFALGIIQGIGGTVSTTQLGQDLASLGQDLYEPPTVHGWPGGRDWINSATSLGRVNLACAILAGEGPYGGKLDPMSLAEKQGRAGGEAAGRFFLELLLQDDFPPSVRDAVLAYAKAENSAAAGGKSPWFRGLAHLVVALPEFQLA